jgi:hypothetical protein
LPPRIGLHIGLPKKAPNTRGLFRDFWGIAAERLRRTPSRGPSEKGTNQNESRSYMHQERRKKKAKRGGARLGWWRDREPGSLPVAYLVTQVGNWGSGSDDVGLMQSTKAPLGSLYCDPKGRRALLRTPSTEGRSVCLCWAKSKPKGPKGCTTQYEATTSSYTYARWDTTMGLQPTC